MFYYYNNNSIPIKIIAIMVQPTIYSRLVFFSEVDRILCIVSKVIYDVITFFIYHYILERRFRGTGFESLDFGVFIVVYQSKTSDRFYFWASSTWFLKKTNLHIWRILDRDLSGLGLVRYGVHNTEDERGTTMRESKKIKQELFRIILTYRFFCHQCTVLAPARFQVSVDAIIITSIVAIILFSFLVGWCIYCIYII